MRTFAQLLSTALLCSAALPMHGAGLPGAETVTPADIATADRPAASREQAQKPRADEQAVAEAIAAQTAAPQTVAPAVSTVSNAKVSFAPKDGARLQRQLTSQSSTTAGNAVLGIGEIRTRVDERWEKSGNQWLLHCTPVEVSVTYGKDVSPSAVKLREALLSLPYTVVFNAQGELVEVRGFDDAAAKVQEALGEDIVFDGGPDLPAHQQKIVSQSPSYQFNWLFGKQWRVDETFERDLAAQLNLADRGSWEQKNTIVAIDPSVLILSFENNGAINDADSRNTISEKGTVTLDPASGQLRQLQKTHQSEFNIPDGKGVLTPHKRSEVINITWTDAD